MKEQDKGDQKIHRCLLPMVRAVGIEPTTHGLTICGEGAKTANFVCIITT